MMTSSSVPSPMYISRLLPWIGLPDPTTHRTCPETAWHEPMGLLSLEAIGSSGCKWALLGSNQ